MTLREWSKLADRQVYPHAVSRDIRWIPDTMSMRHRALLWNLEDYYVARVSGGTIWLDSKQISNSANHSSNER